MALTVRLSDRARADIEEIAAFLSENWSEKAKLDFLIRLTEQLELLSQMPYVGKESFAKKGVREFLLNKQTKIYYQIVGEEVIKVLTIRNTNRDNA